jgi:hypothetical protein
MVAVEAEADTPLEAVEDMPVVVVAVVAAVVGTDDSLIQPV